MDGGAGMRHRRGKKAREERGCLVDFSIRNENRIQSG